MEQYTISHSLDTSFISNHETFIPKGFVDADVFSALIERGYFGERSDEWQHRIRNCGSSGISLQACYDCGCEVLIEPGCNSRICQRCNLAYVRKVKKRIGFIIGKMRVIRFLTISPKNYSRAELNSGFALNDLNRIWQNVRKRLSVDFGFPIRSFVAVREFKWNGKSWNIHLHVVYDGSFVPQKLISNIVWKVTKGRSRYSYIRAASSYVGFGHIKTVKYISKYIGKFEVPNNDTELVTDFFMATKNKKLVTYSADIDSLEYKNYKFSCPICYKGKLQQVLGIIVNSVTGEKYFFELSVNSSERLKVLELERQDQSSILMSKVDRLLQEPFNAIKVESVLTGQELNYLLKFGYIYEARAGEYQALR